jgi:hypothetical protein
MTPVECTPRAPALTPRRAAFTTAALLLACLFPPAMAAGQGRRPAPYGHPGAGGERAGDQTDYGLNFVRNSPPVLRVTVGTY